MQRTTATIGEHGLLATVALVAVFPLYVMLLTAVTPSEELTTGLPALPHGGVTLGNFTFAWDDLGFGRMLVNSVVLSGGAALVATGVSVAAAFGLTRWRFAGRRLILVGTIGFMAIPVIVVIVPVFLLFVDLGLVNSYAGGILTMAGVLTPFCTFLLYSYMRDLPDELFEAAKVDGASPLRQFVLIAVPLSRPILITTLLVSAVFAWNDLLIPLVMWQTEELVTLMVGLASLAPGRTGATDLPLLMAGVTISIAPLFVAFLAGRRLLVAGLTEGADR